MINRLKKYILWYHLNITHIFLKFSNRFSKFKALCGLGEGDKSLLNSLLGVWNFKVKKTEEFLTTRKGQGPSAKLRAPNWPFSEVPN